MVTTIGGKQVVDQPAGIFIRSSEQLSFEDRRLLKAVARLVLNDTSGPL